MLIEIVTCWMQKKSNRNGMIEFYFRLGINSKLILKSLAWKTTGY